MKKHYILSLILIYVLNASVSAQSLVDDASVVTSQAAPGAENVYNETIKVISSSKKIFVLTNNSQQFGPGDFISIALDNNLAARAVVGKSHQGQIGIKILKIYSLTQWSKLRRDLEVQIIRGDDSYFGKKPEEPKPEEIAKIKSEEELYTGEVVESDEIADIDSNKNRHIKPDNIVGAYGSFITVDEVQSNTKSGGSVRANEFGATWAFQFTDNYFVEGIYGRATIKGFPAKGAETLIYRGIARLKYNIKGPLYTFFLPYIGYQYRGVSSPDAGKSSDNALNARENSAIEKLQKSGPVFGVTVLRRLVPGWFIKADLGTDLLNVGFAIEF